MQDAKGNKKKIHGNRARIDPQKQVEGLYQTNRAALSSKLEDATPLVQDDDVAYARRFVEENKK